MKNMQFPIDIIWIYKNKVVLVEKNIPPPSLLVGDEKLIPRYGYGVLADKILEIQAVEFFLDNKAIQQELKIFFRLTALCYFFTLSRL